jgi:ABC-type Zn uptake system ZnuABC Zn-binding protein ZnuA
MRKISAADLFIVNGFGLEEFLGAPVRKSNPRITVVETAAAATRSGRPRTGTGTVKSTPTCG